MGNKQKSVIFWAVVCALLTQNLVIPVMSRASFEEQKTYYSPDPSTGTPPSSGSHTPSHGSGGGHGTPSHGSGSHGGNPPAGNCGNPPTTPSGGHHHHHHNPTPSPPSGGHGGGGYSPSPPTHHGGTTPSTPTPSTPSTPTTPSTPIVTPTPDPGTPTTPGGGGYYPSPTTPTPSTPSTPSTPIIETPPTPTVDPGTPSTPGGGGYYPSPTPTTPSTPTIETPPTPIIDPGTPSTPGGGSYPSPTPTTPIITPGTPSAPGVFPIDPNSPPFTCDYWRTHPALIWGLFGWWGTVGNSFGVASVPGFGSNMNLLQALSNSRTDAFGDLYREGTASLLNSMVSPRFTYTTNQVRDSFVSALSSDQSAEAQAQLFKLANEGRLKPRA